MTARALNLNDLPLERKNAHGGEGEIFFRRVFSSDDFTGPWNFVDYAVLPPGTSIGVHTHGDNEEIYLVLSGEGTMHLDGQDLAVRPGSVIKNRRGGTHGLRNDSAAEIRIFVIEVAVDTGA